VNPTRGSAPQSLYPAVGHRGGDEGSAPPVNRRSRQPGPAGVVLATCSATATPNHRRPHLPPSPSGDRRRPANSAY